MLLFRYRRIDRPKNSPGRAVTPVPDIGSQLPFHQCRHRSLHDETSIRHLSSTTRAARQSRAVDWYFEKFFRGVPAESIEHPFRLRHS